MYQLQEIVWTPLTESHSFQAHRCAEREEEEEGLVARSSGEKKCLNYVLTRRTEVVGAEAHSVLLLSLSCQCLRGQNLRRMRILLFEEVVVKRLIVLPWEKNSQELVWESLLFVT
jgi:hypothetical protein